MFRQLPWVFFQLYFQLFLLSPDQGPDSAHPPKVPIHPRASDRVPGGVSRLALQPPARAFLPPGLRRPLPLSRGALRAAEEGRGEEEGDLIVLVLPGLLPGGVLREAALDSARGQEEKDGLDLFWDPGLLEVQSPGVCVLGQDARDGGLTLSRTPEASGRGQGCDSFLDLRLRKVGEKNSLREYFFSEL